MSNAITDTAEAVKDAINAAFLAGDLGNDKLTAVRQWLPTVKLEDIGRNIFVLVVARGMEVTLATRSHDYTDVLVDVAVFKKLVTGDDETECDAMFDVIQNIAGVIRGGIDGVSYKGRASDPIFDVTTLETQRVLRTATTFRLQVYHDVRV